MSLRYDEDGRVITARASSQRCRDCRRPFAAGHLPADGTLVCRDCRDEGTPPPSLFAVPPLQVVRDRD